MSGEADVLALSASGYLTEVEIKISVADFRRDAAKAKHSPRWHTRTDLVSAFYYAMPEMMWPKVETEFASDRAGLILVSDAGIARVSIKAPPRPCRKLNEAERLHLGRLGTMRYWTRLSHKRDAI